MPKQTEINNPDILVKLLDMADLFGSDTAAKILQTALDSANLSAVNAAEPITLLASFKTLLVSHAVSIVAAKPAARALFSDWVKRINS